MAFEWPSFEWLAAAAVSGLLLVYLGYAMFNPEKF